MIPANITRLKKASRELHDIAGSRQNAQDVTLSLFRTLGLIHHVLVDLALRPEVNSLSAEAPDGR